MCSDCGGWDIEWMHHCHKHKGVQFCRGCACPDCAEDDLNADVDNAYRDMGDERDH